MTEPRSPHPLVLTRCLIGRAKGHRWIVVAAVVAMIVASLAEVAPILLAKGAGEILLEVEDADEEAFAGWMLRAGDDVAGWLGWEPSDRRLPALWLIAGIMIPAGIRPSWRYQESSRTSVSVQIDPSFIDPGTASSPVMRSARRSGGSGMRTWRT